jgi:hypothetical protein
MAQSFNRDALSAHDAARVAEAQRLERTRPKDPRKRFAATEEGQEAFDRWLAGLPRGDRVICNVICVPDPKKPQPQALSRHARRRPQDLGEAGWPGARPLHRAHPAGSDRGLNHGVARRQPVEGGNLDGSRLPRQVRQRDVLRAAEARARLAALRADGAQRVGPELRRRLNGAAGFASRWPRTLARTTLSFKSSSDARGS